VKKSGSGCPSNMFPVNSQLLTFWRTFSRLGRLPAKRLKVDACYLEYFKEVKQYLEKEEF